MAKKVKKLGYQFQAVQATFLFKKNFKGCIINDIKALIHSFPFLIIKITLSCIIG